ncbi:MAG TPA: hydrolase [Polyangia bacterium]|nr:hydrolase [Polyangia bacterium]
MRSSSSARIAVAALAAAACAPNGAPTDAAREASNDAGVASARADARDASTPTPRPDAAPRTDVAPETSRACAALALCDDFEHAAVGGPPDPTKWTVGAPDVTGTGALAVDDAQHHSGARSVKVTGQGGYSNHIFFTNADVIATLGPVVWGRFYVRLSDALGDGHVTFLAMKDTSDGGKHLRLGGQSQILMWNRESDDATLPDLSPAGIALSEPLPTGRWLCVELTVDEGAGTMQTWVDGAEIAGLHLDATPTPDVDDQWLRRADWRPALADFALGWESYAGQAMTLWFDDVALDAARIGCL